MKTRLTTINHKWRSFSIGKYKLELNQLRTLHSGVGYKLGCGHDITASYHSFSINGTERWSKLTGLRILSNEH